MSARRKKNLFCSRDQLDHDSDSAKINDCKVARWKVLRKLPDCFGAGWTGIRGWMTWTAEFAAIFGWLTGSRLWNVESFCQQISERLSMIHPIRLCATLSDSQKSDFRWCDRSINESRYWLWSDSLLFSHEGFTEIVLFRWLCKKKYQRRSISHKVASIFQLALINLLSAINRWLLHL